ncbi:hypothetical protein NC653_017974 [Populus alba x Populus x berolinensis]|uniref:Uncharacterized protein n=1 Tax=Populus alba x Populus x berolinensis TaxID=444605 RepID=A0AAD6W170_9ROSI|nr:hypothetical protein NC653_017974 [Populus alba x Populus x berolinensis]
MYMLCTRPIFNSDICFDRILEQGKASLFSREGMRQLQCLMLICTCRLPSIVCQAS